MTWTLEAGHNSAMRLVLLSALLVSACAGQTPEPVAASPAPVAEAPTPVTYSSPVVQGEIPRDALVGVLELGLGSFLRGVATEPHLVEGEFVGFRVVALYPDDPRFAQLDLQPGDVVTRINGQRIERPEQAFEIWSSLRVSSELLVEYLKEGEPRRLRFAIVD